MHKEGDRDGGKSSCLLHVDSTCESNNSLNKERNFTALLLCKILRPGASSERRWQKQQNAKTIFSSLLLLQQITEIHKFTQNINIKNFFYDINICKNEERLSRLDSHLSPSQCSIRSFFRVSHSIKILFRFPERSPKIFI